jgi:hypothetical protein
MRHTFTGVAVVSFVLLWLSASAFAAIDCRYAAKGAKSAELLPHGACGTLRGDELRVVRAHLKRMQFTDGLAAVLVRDKVFYVNKAGKAVRVLVFENGPDYFAEGLARAVAKNKVGFVNRKLRVVIKPAYDFAFPFDQGRAAVCTGCKAVPQGEHVSIEGGTWGAIDKAGTVVIPLELTREALFQKLGGKQERGR